MIPRRRTRSGGSSWLGDDRKRRGPRNTRLRAVFGLICIETFPFFSPVRSESVPFNAEDENAPSSTSPKRNVKRNIKRNIKRNMKCSIQRNVTSFPRTSKITFRRGKRDRRRRVPRFHRVSYVTTRYKIYARIDRARPIKTFAERFN